jgi:saccharopine dehydrogenase-like NADP-dependent oxidoreductase
MKVVLLGCGFHGRGIAYQLAGSTFELSVLDRDEERAAAVGAKAGVDWGAADVTDPDGLRAALAGAGLVVNAVGPYHRTALGVVEAALDVGAHYVDMNDDHEVAETLLLDPAWDERARAAGVTVLLDCGVVPGLSGMLVRHAVDRLEETDRIAIRFGWNYNRAYPAAIQHFLRINSGRGVQVVDGEHVRMPAFAGGEEVDFHEPVGRVGVYFTGVPDPVAIARFVPGVREATAKGAFYQDEANQLVRDLIRWGFTAYEPPAAGLPGPLDYVVAYLGSAAGEPYYEIPRHEQPLALRIEVDGSLEGAGATLGYEVHDRSRRATTTFTALAALAVAEGKLAPGVLTPEAWPDAGAFLRELLADRDVRILHWRDGEPAGPLEPDVV